MYDPRTELPTPSRYAATRLQPEIGQIVLYAGQGYLIASILDMSQPLYADWPSGIHLMLRRPHWPKSQFLVVPAREVSQPEELAA